jgi:hypothetical protein
VLAKMKVSITIKSDDDKLIETQSIGMTFNDHEGELMNVDVEAISEAVTNQLSIDFPYIFQRFLDKQKSMNQKKDARSINGYCANDCGKYVHGNDSFCSDTCEQQYDEILNRMLGL